jgi:endonuclease G
MPTASLVRAAFFALGAAVGGGAVVALHASKRKDAPSLPSTRSTEVSGSKVVPNLPVVEVGVAGDPRFSAGIATTAGPILKYGNPGAQRDSGSPLLYTG